MVMVQKGRCPKGSGPCAATVLIPSERSPKTVGTAVEFVLFHGFHVEMSWVKKAPAYIVEDGVLGNLASPGDLEESASHHV